MTEPYFTKLAAAIEGAELGAFLDYLLKLDLSTSTTATRRIRTD